MTLLKKIAFLTVCTTLTLGIASAQQHEPLSDEEVRARRVISIDELCPPHKPSMAQMLPIIAPIQLITILPDPTAPQFLFYNIGTKSLERRRVSSPEELMETIPLSLPDEQLFHFAEVTDSGQILIQTGKRHILKPTKYHYSTSPQLFLLTPEKTLEEITSPDRPHTYLHQVIRDDLILEFTPREGHSGGTPVLSKQYIRRNLTTGTDTVIGEAPRGIHLHFDAHGAPTYATKSTQEGATELLTITRDAQGQLQFHSAYTTPVEGRIDHYNPAAESGESTLYFRKPTGEARFLKPFKHVATSDDEAHTTQILRHVNADIKETLEIQPGLYMYSLNEGGKKVGRFYTTESQNAQYATFIQAWEMLQKFHENEAPQNTLKLAFLDRISLARLEMPQQLNGKIVFPFLRTSPTAPTEYFFHTFDLEAFKALEGKVAPSEEERQGMHSITRFPLPDPGKHIRHKLRMPEVVRIPSEDIKLGGAFEMETFFTPPNPDMVEGDQPPLFVYIHGGPHSRDKLQFNPIIQYLQSHGISVIQPQFPGSTGYGQRYKQASDGAWGKTADYIMSAIEWARREKNIDPRRIIVGGVSYGATAAIQFLARYPGVAQGAIALNGVYNYEQDLTRHRHSPHWVQQMGATPEIRLENSVYPHLDKIEGWAMLFAGTEDDICHPEESEGLFQALDAAGKDASLWTLVGRKHALEWSDGAAPTPAEKGFLDLGAWRFIAHKFMEKVSPLNIRHEDTSRPFSGEPAEHGVTERHTARAAAAHMPLEISNALPSTEDASTPSVTPDTE